MADNQWSRRALFNAYIATGATTPLETTVLDMNGFENLLLVGIATVTSTGNRIQVLGGTATATGAGNFSQFVGETSALTTALALDVYRPVKRFAQGQLSATAASSPIRALVAIRYGGRAQPTTQDAGITLNRLYSPVSGTATAT